MVNTFLFRHVDPSAERLFLSLACYRLLWIGLRVRLGVFLRHLVAAA